MLNVSFKERVLIIAIAIFAMPIHELGHWLGYRFSGISATFHYSFTEPLNNIQNIWGLAGGPLISLVLALLGLIMVYKDKKNQDIWAYFSIIMCLTRVNSYLVLTIIPSSFSENDEGLIAKVLNLPVWLVYLIFTSLFIGVLFNIVYKYKENIYNHIKKYKYGYVLYLILTIVAGIQIV